MYWFRFIKTLAQHLQFCWTNKAELNKSPNFLRRHIFQIAGKLPHHPPTENSSLFLITGWLWHDPFTVDFVRPLEGIIIPLFHLCSARVSFQSATSLPKDQSQRISSAEHPKPLSLSPNKLNKLTFSPKIPKHRVPRTLFKRSLAMLNKSNAAELDEVLSCTKIQQGIEGWNYTPENCTY